tara:strand:- start:1258 stop:2778 length:1521 start_codon:yes stop_codon:yes gene_type:complete
MSYANPQTVVDTESAKYYAQGISNIGQTTAKLIQSQGDKKRAIARANKKTNIRNFNLNTKFNEEYLASANKLTKDFDLRDYVGEDLNELITKAANTKVELQNTKDSNRRLELKKLNMMYEQFFNGGGLEAGISNLAGEREDFSAKEQQMGSEDGLSASGTNSNLYSDLGSTFKGRPRKPLDIKFENIDGSLNMVLEFSHKDKEPTRYNANKDFGPETILLNPNFSTGITNVLEKAKIQDGEKINQKSKGFQDLVTGNTIEKNGLLYDEISYDRLYNLLSPGLVAEVGGIIRSGKSGEGDLGMGARQVQSYVDDILPEKYDKMIGEIKIDITTKSGLDEKSWNNLSKAIVEVKKEELQQGLDSKSVEKVDKPTEGAIKRGITSTRLKTLTNKLDTLNTKRPTLKGAKKQDILFDSELQKELLPEFSFKKLQGDERGDYLTLASTATGKAAEIPSKGLNDARLKMTMWILDGGTTSDPKYIELQKQDKTESKVSGLPIVFDPLQYVKQ